MDRVVLVLFCWIVFWVVAGVGYGFWLGGQSEAGRWALFGLAFGFVSTLLWPLIIPSRLDDWMDHQR